MKKILFVVLCGFTCAALAGSGLDDEVSALGSSMVSSLHTVLESGSKIFYTVEILLVALFFKKNPPMVIGSGAFAAILYQAAIATLA